MKQTPLFRRIVFVDWHGVISKDPFWTSILQNPSHPLRQELQQKLGNIFAQKTFTHDWMKGLVSSADVVAALEIRLDRRFRDDFLSRRLRSDCTNMRVNVALLEALWRLTPVIPVVLATDNMDCFAQALTRVRSRKRRDPRKANFADWADLYDDVICSSEIGALKAEDPLGFFGPTLTKYGLRFADALLIDDRADNCEAFRTAGGSTIQWKMGTASEDEAVSAIHEWLGWTASADQPTDTGGHTLLARAVA